MLSLEGKQLGNYDVIRRIRVGGMGAVYEGRQRTAFDRRVAIKVILGDYAADRDMRRRFAREARTIARLHHPHILPLIEFGDEQGMLYLVMPFIEGGTLTSYMRRSLPDLGEVSAMYQQLLDAVEYAHDEGLIHRDIKSSNVLLELRRNAAPYVYLADFGLVRTMRQNDPSLVGKPIPLEQVPGTPHYMAPEQTLGIVTPLTDIYALGVLLYQMLTGELPYNDPDDVRVIQMHLHSPIPSPCEHDSSIPTELGEVVCRAMAKRPEDRYHNVGEMRVAFLKAFKAPLTKTPEVEPLQRPPARSATTIPLEGGRRTYPLQSPPPFLEAPVPIVMPRRPRVDVTPPSPVVREWQGQTPRVTETFRHRPRITEEPTQLKRQKRRRSFAPSLLIAIAALVTTILLSLLIVPRALGISIFPAGFPVLGTAPVATVYITPQTQSLQDKYLFTASDQIKVADPAAHAVPDHAVKNAAETTATVNTTGVKTTPAVPAHGVIELTNNSDTAIQLPPNLDLKSATGAHILVAQVANMAAHQTVEATAIAMLGGAAGNVAAHSLDGTCCTNNTITIKNLAPFSGGVDEQTMHTVTQADLDGVKNSQEPKLEQQIVQQIQKQLGPDELMAGNPSYDIQVSSNIGVDMQADQVQVTIKTAGSAYIYNRGVIEQTAVQILQDQATRTLDKAYRVAQRPTLTVPPNFIQLKDGIAYLNVSVHGTWVYTFTQSQMSSWLAPIKGGSVEAAQAYLKSQAGIATVSIHLPFGTSQLPDSVDNIKIMLSEGGS